MAVDDLSRRVLYVGDGSSTEFAFNFVVFVATDVAVYTKDEEGEDKLISPSNYTVTLNENQDNNPGGVVKFNSAPADEAVIAVVSAVPETQPMVLTTYDGFDPEVTLFPNRSNYRGYDSGSVPQLRSFVFGLNLSF